MAFTLTPAVAEDFIGREEIVTELTKQLSSKNRMGFSLSGIRRIGKTSILKEVERKLSNSKKFPVIYVSIWRVSPNTIDEFVKVMNRATIKAFLDKLPIKLKFEQLLVTGKTALATFLQNLKLSSKVAEDFEIAISYVRKETSDVDAALTACFSLVEHLGEMTKSRPILIIDEFPSMVNLTYGTKNQKIGDSVIKLIRTLYEDFTRTKLVISGSYRETMKNLVAKQRSPFYKQLLLREVKPFTDSEYDEFIRHYLPTLKFSNDQVKKRLFDLTSGIPYNLQLLGAEIQMQGINVVDQQKLSILIQNVLRKEGELSFKEFVDELTPSEVKVLRAIAESPEIKPNEIAARQFLDRTTVGSSLNVLVRKGVIERSGRAMYRFSDNLFGEWLKIMDDINS